jgi:hypothetical protein
MPLTRLAVTVFLTLGFVTAIMEASPNKLGLAATAAERVALERLLVSDDVVFPSTRTMTDFDVAQSPHIESNVAAAYNGGEFEVTGFGPAFVVLLAFFLLSLGAMRLPDGVAGVGRTRAPLRH